MAFQSMEVGISVSSRMTTLSWVDFYLVPVSFFFSSVVQSAMKLTPTVEVCPSTELWASRAARLALKRVDLN